MGGTGNPGLTVVKRLCTLNHNVIAGGASNGID